MTAVATCYDSSQLTEFRIEKLFSQVEFEQAPDDVAAKARCLLEPWDLPWTFLNSLIQGSQGMRSDFGSQN